MHDSEIIQCLTDMTGFTVEKLPAELEYRATDGPLLKIYIEADPELISLWCMLPTPVNVPLAETLLRINCTWRDPSCSWLYHDPEHGSPILVCALPQEETSAREFLASAPLFFKACSSMHDTLSRAGHG
ncbi:type III secretion system chaperone [Pseudomonas entomophila]|uniref:type III secretion system chaperone n=1 Tax=Pseudomonas entomophila TaxID=312306 RepID=UPI001EFFC68E|nr:type III secretion system chaperone [Pseudomonas entomophila]MCG8291442.1 type III secretion system chaperone [Pseudomonas entomophila]